MRILGIIGICIATLLVVLIAIFLRRRILMSGGGTIRLQVRVNTMVPGRGWSAGIGQFVGDELRFHRMFSFAIRPKRILNRRTLAVDNRRLPAGPERLTMPGHWVILLCGTGDSELEIAMAESTVTGFLSWLEAGPPGAPGTLMLRPATTPRSLRNTSRPAGAPGAATRPAGASGAASRPAGAPGSAGTSRPPGPAGSPRPGSTPDPAAAPHVASGPHPPSTPRPAQG